MRITYDCILLTNAYIGSSVIDARNKVLAAITERYVDDVEAFGLPLLDDLFSKVLRLCADDHVDNPGFIEGVEERRVLLVEPWRVEGHVGSDCQMPMVYAEVGCEYQLLSETWL